MTGLNPDQVNVAVRCYAACPDDIDERIAGDAQVTQREKELCAAQQRLLNRRS